MKSKMSNTEEKTVFSTCLIGDRAKEGDELSLFTTPRGQYMPMVPRDAHLCSKCNQPAGRFLTELDTSIMQSGQLGSAIGDAKFEQMKAELVGGGDPVVLEAEVDLRIAGRTMLKTTLEKLVKGWVTIEGEVMTTAGSQPTPFCLVARTDTVEARVKLLRDTKIAGEAIQVRFSIKGKFLSDVTEVYDSSTLGELVRG